MIPPIVKDPDIKVTLNFDNREIPQSEILIMYKPLSTDYCIHELLVGTCSICLKIPDDLHKTAKTQMICGQCGGNIWPGDFIQVKVTTFNNLARRRTVGECCGE